MSAGKGSTAIGRDLFAAICRTQLRVTQEEFWRCLESGRPVERPVPVEPEPVNAMPVWLALRLEVELGMAQSEIAKLTELQARKLLDDFRSRPR